MGVWYCTREDVKTALDVAETARNNAQVDRAIEGASRFIDGDRPGDGFLHRRFYPEIATRYFDWPNFQHGRPWRLWLGADELISVTSLTSGGVTIGSDGYFLEPVNAGPPYDRIEINLASASAFSAGSTFQRSIAALGVFGFRADEEPAGALTRALNDIETRIDVTDSSLVGVGQLLRVGAERMIVTGRSMLTTGQTLQTPLAASVANVTVAVTNGAAYSVGEVLLLDSERMLIVDVAGNQLTVKRAWDGTVLATHAGATIYAPRTLTVTRGALGTTTAAHNTAAPVARHVVPGLVRDLCIAEALNTCLQEGTGYARPNVRQAQSQDPKKTPAYGVGLDALRQQTYAAYGRKARGLAV